MSSFFWACPFNSFGVNEAFILSLSSLNLSEFMQAWAMMLGLTYDLLYANFTMTYMSI